VRLLAVMALVSVPAGCSGDDAAEQVTQPTPTPSARPTPTASPGAQIQVAGLTANYHSFAEIRPDGEVSIDLADDHFAPTVLRGAPGQKVTLTLRNTSETPHHFATADQQLIVEVQPGLTAEGKITLPRSGNLSFFCEMHREDGMAGGFNVSGPMDAPDPKASPTATPPAGNPDEEHPPSERPRTGPSRRAPASDMPGPATLSPPAPGTPSPR
jgi:plastocyanin